MSGTASELTNPNDVDSGSAAPFRASGPGPASMPDITNPGVAPGEGLAISAWAAVRPRCQSSLAGFLFAHAVVLPDGTSSVTTSVLGCRRAPIARPLPRGLFVQQRLTEPVELDDHLLPCLSHGQASASAPNTLRRQGPAEPAFTPASQGEGSVAWPARRIREATDASGRTHNRRICRIRRDQSIAWARTQSRRSETR